VRNHPALARQEWLWSALRAPYRAVLRMRSGRRGLPVSVNGSEPFRLLGVYTAELNYEPDFWAAALGVVRPGDHVVDVGAFHGVYTMAFARAVGPGGRVLALEPNPLSRRRLEEHLLLNGFADRVIIEDCLAGECTGTQPFDAVGGGDFIAAGKSARRPGAATNVRTESLDTLVRRHKLQPRLLKIDVEGYEEAVLRGAEATMRGARPFVALEIHAAELAGAGSSVGRIAELAASFHYDPVEGGWDDPEPTFWRMLAPRH
jgi:FkbM family methyltransferase